MAKKKNKIVGQGEKPASEFKFNPNNWRTHSSQQAETLKAILGEVGWVQRVIVNRVTGNLVDGHARVAEALKQGSNTPVPFVEVELTVDEELRVLATFDPVKEMAGNDAQALRQLLDTVTLENSSLLTLGEKLAEQIKDYEGDFGKKAKDDNRRFIAVCPTCLKEFDARLHKVEGQQ